MTASSQTIDPRRDAPRPIALADELQHAQSVLTTYFSEQSSLARQVACLRSRLNQQRLQLAVLGQFKRGKSTFINALLGAPILPTGVVPLTAVAIFIEWGCEPVARVLFNDNRVPETYRSDDAHSVRDFLSRFVSEEQNPKNRLDVRRVELSYPAPILEDGTVLIDTPGVGSTFQHNTDAAIEVLPECDAALFILSADPPITEAELHYLERLKTASMRLFFVLNKADYLKGDEQQIAIEFLRKVLLERSLSDCGAPIFPISARNGLAAKQQGDRAELDRSGIAIIENHLLHYLAAERLEVLQHAIRRKIIGILSQARTDAELQMQTLRIPIEDLASRGVSFGESLRAIEERRLTTGDLLAGDRRRLIGELEDRIQKLREEASVELASLLDEHLFRSPPSNEEQIVKDIIPVAIQEFFEQGRDLLVGVFRREVMQALRVHQQRLDDLVDSVRRTAAELFDISLAPQYGADSFEVIEDPYWVTQSINQTLMPNPNRIIDRIVSPATRRARLRVRIMQQAGELIIRNAENLRWAILQGIENTMRNAAATLEERLDQAVAATKGIIDEALVQRRDRSLSVDPEIERLGHAIADLREVNDKLAAQSD
jgi:GTP-binding protein EngB required for normal cell division